ncbi:MAG: Nif3-like dinuclear metal center hexameric protein [Phycisphaerales bacterium]|nr:Nif3-like dinuclear metal center hexameric protein [Phycisphaerales bacterium]
MPRGRSWDAGIGRGVSDGSAPRGPGSDDRGWTRKVVQRGGAQGLPDAPEESLLAKGGLNRHGVSTGRIAQGAPEATTGPQAAQDRTMPRESRVRRAAPATDSPPQTPLPGASPRAARTGSAARGGSAKRRGSSAGGRGGGKGAARRRATVADLLAALDQLAPLRHAADWDNVGLLAGQAARRVQRVLVAIDLTDAVAAEALRERADALVLYHPPIFKGIRSITAAAACPTSALCELLAARTALLAVHTALDAAVGGTNDLLLDAFDVAERVPIEPAFEDGRQFKLAVFVPVDQAAELRAALSAAGAGRIGNYDECSFETAGVGTFRGNESSNPRIGRRGRFEAVAELRIEMVVPAAALAAVVRALHAVHPYEEPAFDIYPLRGVAGRGAVGMGRIGRLRNPADGRSLIQQLGRVVDLRNARVVGSLDRRFEAVAAAAGSFGVARFTDPRTLYLTGEFKHHDALELLKRGATAVHIGHYESERPVVGRLAGWLRTHLPGSAVRESRADKSPFDPIDPPVSKGRPPGRRR